MQTDSHTSHTVVPNSISVHVRDAGTDKCILLFLGSFYVTIVDRQDTFEGHAVGEAYRLGAYGDIALCDATQQPCTGNTRQWHPAVDAIAVRTHTNPF